VNTDAYYERQPTRPEPQAPPTPLTEAELSALARHGDPSLALQSGSLLPRAGGRSITWVRPSELVTSVTSPMLRRGTDLQAELARRAPSAVSPAGRRVTRSAIARPELTVPTREGLGL
jgi:hypothetical protein